MNYNKKSLDNEIKETKNFQYCKTGNEKYLNDIIQSLLNKKITYLKSLKNEVLGI